MSSLSLEYEVIFKPRASPIQNQKACVLTLLDKCELDRSSTLHSLSLLQLVSHPRMLCFHMEQKVHTAILGTIVFSSVVLTLSNANIIQVS